MSDSILNLIESILMWEGQFNSQTLMERLGVSRPTVSKQIGIYKKRYPKNIYYDASAKFYFASKQFQPVLGPHSLSVLVKPKWTRLIDNFHTQPESYHH